MKKIAIMAPALASISSAASAQQYYQYQYPDPYGAYPGAGTDNGRIQQWYGPGGQLNTVMPDGTRYQTSRQGGMYNTVPVVRPPRSNTLCRLPNGGFRQC